MSTEFLPPDYEAPSTQGSYMKLQDGENKIRILSSPILGWEEWIDKKPIRYKYQEQPEKWHDLAKPGRHFWSMVVWNYAEEKIQILHLIQASIQKAIRDLSNDNDWGVPFFYDIKISRTGKDLLTKYTVNPSPHKDLPEYVEQAYQESPCRLEALFDGDDPFGQWTNYTSCVFTKKKVECEKKELIEDLPF